MSLLSWFLKPKREMAKTNTKRVRLGKYKVSAHAQNRIVDPARKLKKKDMITNLFTKPNALTMIATDNLGRKSYNRIGKKITTTINPKDNVVATVRLVSKSEIKKHNLVKKGDKYVKRRK